MTEFIYIERGKSSYKVPALQTINKEFVFSKFKFNFDLAFDVPEAFRAHFENNKIHLILLFYMNRLNSILKRNLVF